MVFLIARNLGPVESPPPSSMLKYRRPTRAFGLASLISFRSVCFRATVLQPISQDELKEYLIRNGDLTDVKAEVVARQTFRKAREQGKPVTRGDAKEICSQDSKVKISNAFQFHNNQNTQLE